VKPLPEPNEVSVRVMAASLNPADYKFSKEALGPIFGIDFSGVIESVGAEVHGFSSGDEVWGIAPGCLADFAIANPDKITKKEPVWDWVHAAAVPTAYLAAYQALGRQKRKKWSDATVVVIGASGGTGIATVQLAKAFGASVIVGICSAAKAQFVLQQGASRIVDYNDSNAMKDAEDSTSADLVVDCASASGGGEDYFSWSAKLVQTSGGICVALSSEKNETWAELMTNGTAAENGSEVMLVQQNAEDLRVIQALLRQANMLPVVGKELPFSKRDIDTAYDALKSRRALGKIVINMHEHPV